VKTDPLFYRLFETSPETFFVLLGMSADVAADTAARYESMATEFKTCRCARQSCMPCWRGLPRCAISASRLLFHPKAAGEKFTWGPIRKRWSPRIPSTLLPSRACAWRT
jgi:hypothetical protein